MNPLLRGAGAVLALSALIGCQASAPVEQPSPVAASGTVLFRGKPLPDATVSFLALDGQISSRGVTDERGEFVLSTYARDDGAPVGKYKVLVSLDEFDVSPEGRPVPRAKKRTELSVPVRYARPAESPLTAEIVSSGANRFSFDLK